MMRNTVNSIIRSQRSQSSNREGYLQSNLTNKWLVISILACLNTACQNSLRERTDPFVAVHVAQTVSNNLNRYIDFDQPVIAILNARIVDGTGESVGKSQTLIVKNGLIAKIGKKVVLPPGAKIIDASGKTIIPGIIGVHNHLHVPGFPFIGDVAIKLYFASGLTTIQTCGAASPSKELRLANEVQEGAKIGPEIISTAPYITGNGGSASMIIPRNETHLRDTMQYWLRQGVKWFKVYRHTTPADLEVVIDEAHANGAKVTGHFCSITYEEATKMGVDGIEHGLNAAADFRINKDYGMCNGSREYMDELDLSSPEVERLLQLMIDSTVFLNSTLSIYESSIPSRAHADDRSLRAMAPFLVKAYNERREAHQTNPSLVDREQRLKRIMEFEYRFFQMGGLLGAGSDPGRHNLPGYGDQRNFELLVEAGFSTAEAIKVMTSNGAEILDLKDRGSIEEGKRADFVILDGDLTIDSSVIRNVEHVFKGGIGYNSGTIINETDGKVGQ